MGTYWRSSLIFTHGECGWKISKNWQRLLHVNRFYFWEDVQRLECWNCSNQHISWWNSLVKIEQRRDGGKKGISELVPKLDPENQRGFKVAKINWLWKQLLWSFKINWHIGDSPTRLVRRVSWVFTRRDRLLAAEYQIGKYCVSASYLHQFKFDY